jgi:NADH-quinone oxidoreductase subunit A
MPQDYLPVLFQILIAIGFAVSTLTASVIFGRSAKRNATKDSAYECGMLPIGEGAPRFSVKFYLVAMLFVIFDIEVVFMRCSSAIWWHKAPLRWSVWPASRAFLFLPMFTP